MEILLENIRNDIQAHVKEEISKMRFWSGSEEPTVILVNERTHFVKAAPFVHGNFLNPPSTQGRMMLQLMQPWDHQRLFDPVHRMSRFDYTRAGMLQGMLERPKDLVEHPLTEIQVMTYMGVQGGPCPTLHDALRLDLFSLVETIENRMQIPPTSMIEQILKDHLTPRPGPSPMNLLNLTSSHLYPLLKQLLLLDDYVLQAPKVTNKNDPLMTRKLFMEREQGRMPSSEASSRLPM